MIESLLAVVGLVLILVLWVAVQQAWRRAFPGAAPDGDVLAIRRECDHCSGKPGDGRYEDAAGRCTRREE